MLVWCTYVCVYGWVFLGSFVRTDLICYLYCSFRVFFVPGVIDGSTFFCFLLSAYAPCTTSFLIHISMCFWYREIRSFRCRGGQMNKSAYYCAWLWQPKKMDSKHNYRENKKKLPKQFSHQIQYYYIPHFLPWFIRWLICAFFFCLNEQKKFPEEFHWILPLCSINVYTFFRIVSRTIGMRHIISSILFAFFVIFQGIL